MKRMLAFICDGVGKATFGVSHFAVFQFHNGRRLAYPEIDKIRIADGDIHIIMMMLVDKSAGFGGSEHVKDANKIVLQHKMMAGLRRHFHHGWLLGRSQTDQQRERILQKSQHGNSCQRILMTGPRKLNCGFSTRAKSSRPQRPPRRPRRSRNSATRYWWCALPGGHLRRAG